MRLSFEHHGPYIFKNKKYIVKEYFNLDSCYFQKYPIFDFNNVKIIEEIEGDPEIDFFGHAIGNYKIINSLLVVDDKIIKNTEDFYNVIFNKFLELDKLFLEYDVKDYAKNLTYGLYFSLKPLTTLLNLDWNPKSEVIDEINKFKLFFPKDKVINYIKSTDIKDIEKKVYLSFKEIFENE